MNIEAMKLALAALEEVATKLYSEDNNNLVARAIPALRAAIAKDALQRLTDVQQDMEKGGDNSPPPYALILADRFEGFSIDHDPQGWPAIRQSELLKAAAELRNQHEEIERLNKCLAWEQHRAEHVGTHGPGCAMWGPKHYECLLRAHEALKTQTVLRESLQKRTTQESRQVEPPKREPLTDKEISDLFDGQIFHLTDVHLVIDFVRDIERAHGIGGEE